MEAFMKLMGMCITFIPSVYFASYMIKKLLVSKDLIFI